MFIGLLRSVPWADRQGQAAADRDRAAESKRRPNQGPVRDSEIVAPGITRRLVRIRGRIFFALILGRRGTDGSQTLRWREMDSNLYGAFPVKRLFGLC
jgi:hypothetical protein